MIPSLLFLSGLSVASVSAQHYSATYLPWTAPKTTEEGQTGTNQCGTTSSQTSNCQNSYINSFDDWCLWAPPNPGSAIGATEQIEVAWCLKEGYGTRVIPPGTITGSHFVITPDFVQVTGVGDLTKINVMRNDPNGGGELDPHGPDGKGNPHGGLVFSSAFGPLQQLHEWTNFMSDTEFCFRACKPGPKAAAWCQHIYDVMGCAWNMPANYDPGVFEGCKGDSGAEPMGVYGASTFHQGDAQTPAPHPIPSSSNCQTAQTIGGGSAVFVTDGTGPTQSASASSGGSSSGSQSTSAKQTNVASPSGPQQPVNTSTSTSPNQSKTPAPGSAMSLNLGANHILVTLGFATLIGFMMGSL